MRDIRSEIDTINDIVPFPAVVAQIMTELLKGESATHQIARIIETDAALTALILRASNSAYYGFRGEITAISRAVVVLGFEEISRLVLVYQMKQRVFALNASQSEYLEKLWVHSVSTAAIARLIVGYLKYKTDGSEFTGGLLHDMGKIVLVQYFPDALALSQQMMDDLMLNDVDAEMQALASTHAEIGGLLGEKWNLPGAFIDVMRYHHNIAESNTDRVLIAVVRLADVLSERWGSGIKEEVSADPSLEDDECWGILKIRFPHLNEISTEDFETELKQKFEANQEFVKMFS
jgi:HD-like signal output (HDOD) protein